MPNYIIDTVTRTRQRKPGYYIGNVRYEGRLCPDTGHKTILNRLSKLKTTISIRDNGQYRNCPECSQIAIESTLTADELDNWLWKNNLDYIGVVTDDN